MATDLMETIDIETLSDEQLDRLMERIDQRGEKREAEARARQAAIKRRHTPQGAYDQITSFRLRRRDMESVDDPQRGVRLYPDGSYIMLASPMAALAGMFDKVEEPTDALTKTAVRADFFKTRARLVHGAQRQIVLNDSRRCVEAGLCSVPPEANVKELARLDALIAADMRRAKELESLCDVINQIKTEHQDDEALRDRLIAEALASESKTDGTAA